MPSDLLNLSRLFPPSTRLSCTLATRPPSLLRITRPRASTAPATRVSGPPTHPSTQTRRSRRSPPPRARRSSRFSWSGASKRAGASFPRASPRPASRPTLTLTGGVSRPTRSRRLIPLQTVSRCATMIGCRSRCFSAMTSNRSHMDMQEKVEKSENKDEIK